MAEMADGAALLVEPGDVDALADALVSALGEGREGARRELGIRVASARTWEASVSEHVRAYLVAAGSSQ